MPQIRLKFLPVFFTVLIASFAVAVTLRIRSHHEAEVGENIGAAVATAAGTGASGRTGSGGETVTAAETGSATAGGVSGTAKQASASPSDPRSVREQRYNELLQQPIPSRAPAAAQNQSRTAATTAAPPAPKPSPTPQSMLSRIVAPIAKVFGGSSSPSTSQSSSSSSSTANRVEPQKDPNSDVTPPQLMSVSFNPPSIQDGQETMLTVTATDDISGIRSIAGNVISPSGALQGFAMQRDANDTTRFVAKVLVPKSAAEGFWRINYLNLTDNASNSLTLTANQLPATASFRVVSSDADNTPPTLRAVWLDKASMKGGEKNTIFVQADDDKSGVNLVSGVFISPAKLARIGFGCRAPENGNTFTCEFTPPANADCGDWQLEQVQLQDKANNMKAERRDNPLVAAVHVTVMSDSCDSRPPVVQTVTLDRYATAAPGTIVIRVNVTDDSSGVGSVSGHFVYTGAVAPGSQPPKLWFACSMTDPQTWSGTVAIPDKAAIGIWRLEQLQVLDKANNLKIYSLADRVVSEVTFRVQ